MDSHWAQYDQRTSRSRCTGCTNYQSYWPVSYLRNYHVIFIRELYVIISYLLNKYTVSLSVNEMLLDCHDTITVKPVSFTIHVLVLSSGPTSSLQTPQSWYHAALFASGHFPRNHLSGPNNYNAISSVVHLSVQVNNMSRLYISLPVSWRSSVTIEMTILRGGTVRITLIHRGNVGFRHVEQTLFLYEDMAIVGCLNSAPAAFHPSC